MTPRVADYVISTLDPNSSVPQNLSAVAAARYNSSTGLLVLGSAAVGIAGGTDRFGRSVYLVNVSLVNKGPGVAVAVSLSLRCPAIAVVAETGFIDDRVLPQWASDGLFDLLTGEARSVVIEAALPPSAVTAGPPDFYVVVAGWNVAKRNTSVVFA